MRGYGMDMGAMWLFGVLLLAGLVLLIVLLVRLLTGGLEGRRTGPPPAVGPGAGPPPAWPQPDPLARARQILAERYAAGEIDAAEYDERMRRLRET